MPRSLKDLSFAERLKALREDGAIDDDALYMFGQGTGSLSDWARRLEGRIENAIGAFPVPLGAATNVIVDGVERLVPMATEERSVIAAVSKAAKGCRETGGFRTAVGPNVASGQVLFSGLPKRADVPRIVEALLGARRRFADSLLDGDRMASRGGGLRRIDVAEIRTDDRGTMIAITFGVDTVDAMGANVVTRLGESLATLCTPIVGVRRTAVICTNHSQGSKVTATAAWPAAALGDALIGRILDLQAWAEHDEYRAVTHNKGIMNGVSAICLATGQDVRAVEAAAHAHASAIAAPPSKYAPLTTYRRTTDGIEGELTLHLPLGTVGGATDHPVAALCRRLMGVGSVAGLAAVCGAVGLAQNFAALRSLADEGIPESHERLKRRP